jgi:hypothetical protein
MVELSDKQVKFIGISIVVLVLVLLTAGTYYFFSCLADFISSPASFLLFATSVVLFMRFAIRLLAFPGSFSLWLRNIESQLCKEMSARLAQRIAGLRLFTETLLQETDRDESLSRSMALAAQSKRLLEVLGGTCEELRKEGTLKKRQLQLYTHLTDLRQALQAAKLTLPSHSCVTLWEWLGTDQEDCLYAKFEDCPGNELGLKVLTLCLELEAFLFASWGPTNWINRVRRWLFDNTLGNIDQMRVELKNRFKGERFWVTTGDGKAIDCMWFGAQDFNCDAPTVLLCNPNAGYYEYAFYQNEWLEFYLQNGVNVCMWNYRGFGRSEGSPSVRRLQGDAVEVLKHLKDIRGVTRIAAHGESMGGSVVTYLAAYCKLEFVFADRTFWSLEKVAYFGFGRVALFLLQTFSEKSSDSAANFLSASCPKFLSSDPQDKMIEDLSSLKAGVAELLVQSSSKECAGLPEAGLSSLTEAYGGLMKFIVTFTKTEFARSPRSVKLLAVNQSQPGSQYQLLPKDAEALDDDALPAFIFKVSNSLYTLDAGGKAFMQLSSSSNLPQAMKSWLYVLEVWGSYSNITSLDLDQTRQIAAERLRVCADALKKIAVEFEASTNPLVLALCRDVTGIEGCFSKVVAYLESHRSVRETPSESRPAIDYTAAGHLVPLNCGHSGPFSVPEKMLYEDHLIRIGFISDNS